MRLLAFLLSAAVAVGCALTSEDLSGPDGASETDSGPGIDGGAQDSASDAGPACPPGIICVDGFPYHDDNDTAASSSRQLDGYGCAPSTDESGPEVIYRVTVPEAGFLSAAVDDAPGVDIDLQLLASLDPNDCIARGHRDVGGHVDAGTYYLVADTWVDGTGTELSGPYGLDIGFVVPLPGDCLMSADQVDRLWGPPVQLPAIGPMVLEAHLVTEDDGFAAGQWPLDIWDGIPDHYDISYVQSGLIMFRDQPWAPQESSEFGQGAHGSPLPTLDEAWYVNMLWASRPPAGTRMIVRLPGGGPAIVAAAGYETGPGDTTHIGGVTEEIHFYLGTGHLDEMEIGFAADQTLPLGPIRCQ